MKDINPNFKYDEEIEADIIKIKGVIYYLNGEDLYNTEFYIVGRLRKGKYKIF